MKMLFSALSRLNCRLSLAYFAPVHRWRTTHVALAIIMNLRLVQSQITLKSNSTSKRLQSTSNRATVLQGIFHFRIIVQSI